MNSLVTCIEITLKRFNMVCWRSGTFTVRTIT